MKANKGTQKTGGKSQGQRKVTHCEEMPQGVLLYTKPQMAALLQMSVRSVTNMMRRGELSYLKIGRRTVRFQIDDVSRRLSQTVGVCHQESNP
jgi:hypothetical protein